MKKIIIILSILILTLGLGCNEFIPDPEWNFYNFNGNIVSPAYHGGWLGGPNTGNIVLMKFKDKNGSNLLKDVYNDPKTGLIPSDFMETYVKGNKVNLEQSELNPFLIVDYEGENYILFAIYVMGIEKNMTFYLKSEKLFNDADWHTINTKWKYVGELENPNPCVSVSFDSRKTRFKTLKEPKYFNYKEKTFECRNIVKVDLTI